VRRRPNLIHSTNQLIDSATMTFDAISSISAGHRLVITAKAFRSAAPRQFVVSTVSLHQNSKSGVVRKARIDLTSDTRARYSKGFVK
jgi:hypothetical protein